MHTIAITLVLCALAVIGQAVAYDVPPPDLAELTQAADTKPPTVARAFNDLNNRIRDGRISSAAARVELAQQLAALKAEYYRSGGHDYAPAQWVFPLDRHDYRAIDSGRRHGFMARGYDYYNGNRHGGHPAFDIFIHDRNQDGLEDRTGAPVKVLSMTGGMVVALETGWEPGSKLRGGKYVWVYDPANRLLVYYAHNDRLLVGLGDLVKPGDALATVGRSGYNAAKRRSPTHLHFSVLKVTDSDVKPIDVYNELRRAIVCRDGTCP